MIWKCIPKNLLVVGINGILMVFFGCALHGLSQAPLDVERPEVEENLVVGVSAIGGPYQLTDKPYLVEVARGLREMGSNFIKFNLNPDFSKPPYELKNVPGIDSLTDLISGHPVYRQILEMEFAYYHFWARPSGEFAWHDGITASEEKRLYEEFRELSEYLLTTFDGSGKSFYIGHWEGDWLLLGSRNPEDDPPKERISGMTRYLQIRQRAINDARESVKDTDVEVYHYTEVNLVAKSMDLSRPSLTTTVLPNVDVDYVSYSSYDTIQGDNMRRELHRALDFIEAHMMPRPEQTGKRVFVGEYAIKASSVNYDPEAHDRRNREVTRAIIEWGCPFAVYWQYYCNEKNPNRDIGYEGFWLVNPNGKRYPLYYGFRDYWKSAREFIKRKESSTGQAPSPLEIREFALNYFNMHPGPQKSTHKIVPPVTNPNLN